MTRAHIEAARSGDRVGPAVIEIDKSEHPLPRAAIRLIWEFDARRPVEPFAFELDTGCLLTGLGTARHRDGRRITARYRAALLTAISRLSAR